jgi:hypothetical protein
LILQRSGKANGIYRTQPSAQLFSPFSILTMILSQNSNVHFAQGVKESCISKGTGAVLKTGNNTR